MHQIATTAGPCWVWETPLGWRWSPVSAEDPEDFSDHYPTPAAAEQQAQLWAADQVSGDEWAE